MESVDAVKSSEQRAEVEQRLTEAGAVYADVWKLGINTALRISDLLNITLADLASLDELRPVLTVREGKTGKQRKILLNGAAMEVINRRLAANPDAVYLFQRERKYWRRDADGKLAPAPINRKTVARIFQQVGSSMRPAVHLGTHSMRKTRGYALHQAGMSVEEICKMLNHSNPTVTMRYLGIDQSAIDESFRALEL